MHPEMLDRILADLNATNADIEASTIISTTGLTIASSLPPNVDEDRASAISAAVLALGKRTMQDLLCGELEQVLIKGRQGNVLITHAGEGALIAVLVKPDAQLDPIFNDTHRVAAQVKKYQ